MSVLETERLSVHFGGVRALTDVSLELEAGLVYGLIGPNGSGKSTFINAVSRVGPLTSGGIRIDGQDVSRAKSHHVARLGISRTFQGIRLVPSLTVWENVVVGGEYLRAGARVPSGAGRHATTAGHDRVAAVLDSLELGGLASRYPGDLPYGAQRKVEIARALVGVPKLLLLDEPVAGMSRQERAEIAGVIASVRSAETTVLLVEHDIKFVTELCDHLFVLHFGECVASGTPSDTVRLAVVQDAYLGTAAADD